MSDTWLPVGTQAAEKLRRKYGDRVFTERMGQIQALLANVPEADVIAFVNEHGAERAIEVAMELNHALGGSPLGGAPTLPYEIAVNAMRAGAELAEFKADPEAVKRYASGDRNERDTWSRLHEMAYPAKAEAPEPIAELVGEAVQRHSERVEGRGWKP